MNNYEQIIKVVHKDTNVYLMQGVLIIILTLSWRKSPNRQTVEISSHLANSIFLSNNLYNDVHKDY